MPDTLARFNSQKYTGFSIEIDPTGQRFLVRGTNQEIIENLSVDEVLDAFIGHKLQNGYKRKQPRINVALKSKFRLEDGKTAEAITGTVGGGGLFIESSNPPPVGSRIEFEFVLPHEAAKPVKGSGEVVWTRSKIEREVFFPGMGIQFKEISSEDRNRVLEFVHALDIARNGQDEAVEESET